MHLGGRIRLLLYVLQSALKLGNLIIKICSGSAVILQKMETKVEEVIVSMFLCLWLLLVVLTVALIN